MTSPKPYFFSNTGEQKSLPADDEFLYGVLETMRMQSGRTPLLAGHLARLARSAHPGRATLARIEAVASEIARHTADWPCGARARLRYGVLGGEFVWDFTVVPLEDRSPWAHGVGLGRCATPITPEASCSPFPAMDLGQSAEPRHGLALAPSNGCKLLRRDVYRRAEQELQQYATALRPELFHEGLLLDESGFVIEGLRSNLLVWKNGGWRTPSLRKCGVQGVMLSWLAGQMEISEDALSIRDIEQAGEVAVCNAVRGVVPVVQLALGTPPGEPGGCGATLIALAPGAAIQRVQALVAKALW